MNRTAVVTIRTLIILVAVAALAFLIVEPQVEGRNVNATLVEIYFNDPLLAYAYIASIPFFVGLYQVYKLVKFPEQKALQIIRNCALVTIPFIIIGVTWILQIESDDRPPIIAMGTLSTLICIGVAIASNAFRKKLY